MGLALVWRKAKLNLKLSGVVVSTVERSITLLPSTLGLVFPQLQWKHNDANRMMIVRIFKPSSVMVFSF